MISFLKIKSGNYILKLLESALCHKNQDCSEYICVLSVKISDQAHSIIYLGILGLTNRYSMFKYWYT